MSPLAPRFPIFRDGQILSHADLNLLRDFVYTRYLFQNRALFGSGVACGLESSGPDEGRIRFTPGFALTQSGRELHLDENSNLEFSVGEITSSGAEMQAFSFLEDAGPTGFTAVAVPDDRSEPVSDACGNRDCERHAETRIQGARIVWGTGRLRPTGWRGHTLVELEPLRPERESGFALDGFGALRDALVRELTGELDPGTLARLSQLELTGPPGVDLMKAGVLNEVLYTSWEWVRCREKVEAPCIGEDGEEAVALGVLERVGGTWRWNCRYRHHFRLAPTLYRAIHGMDCRDHCARFLGRIRIVVQNFEPPLPPPAEEPAPPPEEEEEVSICFPGRWGYECPWIPELETPDIPEFFPWDPIWGWKGVPDLIPDLLPGGGRTGPEPMDWWLNQERTDPLGAGIVRLGEWVGRDGASVKDRLDEAIHGAGVEPHVQVVPQAEVTGLEGYAPGFLAATSDTIVLGVNEHGGIVSTGKVPTSRTLQTVSGAFPGVQADLAGARQGLEEVGAQVGQAFDLAQGLEGSFGDLQQQVGLLDDHVGSIQEIVQELPALGEIHGAVDFVGNWDHTHGQLIQQIDLQVQQRFDLQAQSFIRDSFDRQLRDHQMVEAFTGAVRHMEEALLAGASPEHRAEVEGHLEAVEHELGLIQSRAAAGQPIAETHGEAMIAVMDSMKDAVIASGIDPTAPEVVRMDQNLDTFRHVFERGSFGGPVR